MEKTINIKSEELKNNLYSMVNNANLPFATVYYIFKDFMKELTDSYIEALNTEIEQYNKEQEVKEEKPDEEKENMELGE